MKHVGREEKHQPLLGLDQAGFRLRPDLKIPVGTAELDPPCRPVVVCAEGGGEGNIVDPAKPGRGVYVGHLIGAFVKDDPPRSESDAIREFGEEGVARACDTASR